MFAQTNTVWRQKRFWVACALCVSLSLNVMSGDDGWINSPTAFDGLTDENLQDRLDLWLTSVESEQDSALKARKMSMLLGSIASRGLLKASSLDMIDELADRALQLDLTPENRMHAYWHKATTVRRANRYAKGPALQAARREMASNLLTGYKSGLGFVQSYERKHPDFDPTEMPVGVGFWTAPRLPQGVSDEIRARFEAAERNAEEANRKWNEAMSGWQTAKGMKHSFRLAENDLVDIYTRLPHDTKELGTLAMEILGDPEIANRLVAKTNEEIVALAKQGMSKDFKEVEAEIMEMVMEPFDANLLIASASSTTNTIPTASAPPPETEEPTAPEKPKEASGGLLPWIIGVGVVLLIAVGVAVGLRRREQS